MVFSIASLVAFIIAVVFLPFVFIKIIYPDLVRRKPAYAFITAAFFVLIGFLAAFFIFYSAISIAMLAFTSLLLLPFIIKILEPEEKEGSRNIFKLQLSTSETRRIRIREWFSPSTISSILKRNEKLIIFYSFLFFGMALEFMLLFALLPPSISDAAFSQQINVIGPAGNFFGPFGDLLVNNLQILTIAFALSVFFGAGSIFILTYNASIAGVMYGSSLRTIIWGSPMLYSNILLYLPHTILEIFAYLLAAVAGGMLIRGLSRENIRDALIIFAISVVILVFAAYVESTVPYAFS